MDTKLYLLKPYTHHPELQVITAQPLISTLYSSLEHSLSFFQPAVSSRAVPWQRLPTLEILQLPELMSSYHSRPCRTLSIPSIDKFQLPIIKSGVRIRVIVTLRRRFIANQFVLAPSLLRSTTSIFFQLNTCSYSPYVTSSLTKGWISSLQLLLVLASAVILGSDSRGTHDHILLSQIRDSPNLEGEEQGGPVITPGTGFSFRRLIQLAGLRWRYSNPLWNMNTCLHFFL
jgi:hypothetical protein